MTGENGNDQGSPSANESKAARGRSGTPTLFGDWVSSIKEFMEGMGRIRVATVASLVSIGLAYLFLNTPSKDSQKSATKVLSWLERLPTESTFYYSIATVAVAYLVWRWRVYTKLRKEFGENKDERSLTPRDWWVVQGFRERALASRTLAGVLLGGVVALLFGGIYLVLFVIPQVPQSDRYLVKEIQKETQRENVKRQFGHKLQLIGEGRYWFEVADVGLGDTPISGESKTVNTQLAAIALPAGVTLPRLPVLNTHEVSKKELTIFTIGHGKALVTLDGGQTWSARNKLDPEETEIIIAAAFDADGRLGVVASSEGSVFVTQDGGKTWSVPKGLVLNETEWVVAAAFGPDSRRGVVGSDEGSVFVTQDGGKTWSVPKGLVLKEGEWIVTAAFGADGKQHGAVAGNEGSVFVTQDGGKTWSVPKDLVLKETEWIVAAAFGANSQYGAVSNNKGSVFVTQDGGKTWSVPKDLVLKETEWIIAAFDADDRFGVVGDEGSVFVTQDEGETWSVPKDLRLKEGEEIVTAAFDADGRLGVVTGSEGSVFVTQNGGKTWSVPEGLALKEGERIVTAALDADGQFGAVAGSEGSVFVTQNGGKTWSVPEGLALKEGEEIVIAAFDADGRFGVVAGSEGSVFVTQSSALRWNSTERDYQGTSFIDVVSAIPGGRDFVAMDGDGGIHLLKAYPDMAEWENRSLDAMRIRIQEDEILRKSVIGREITKFLDGAFSADGNIDSGEGPKPGNDKGFFSARSDEVALMRVVTLIILFFLVQILVRLHQYSLRLATFWDSRADALLLKQSFAYHKAAAFDDLVAALAPDAYDFKPTPKSGHEAVTHLAGQLLRRESRKS